MTQMADQNLVDELKTHGLVAQTSNEAELKAHLKLHRSVYCGFDPTADSLHVGSLVPLLALRRFQDFGHHPIVVAGGATGSIGDPSGKTAERKLLTFEQLKANIDGVKKQLGSYQDKQIIQLM